MTFRLPDISYPLTVDTIGKTLALGGEITFDCLTCGLHRRLNLVKLARRYGIDYPNGNEKLVEVVFCPSCRPAGRLDRNLVFTHQAPTAERSDWPRKPNAYARAKGV